LTVIDHGIFNLEIDNSVACMNFNPSGTRYPQALINSSFEREYSYLERLQDYSWIPEVLDVDYTNRRIYFKWYNNTCEEKLSTNWKEQLETIVRDLAEQRIYKPSFYTKFFYVDDDDNLRAYAFYSASDKSEQPISMDFYRPILNPHRSALVDQLEVNGKLDMAVLVEHAYTDYIKWPDDTLLKIYNKIYCKMLYI
jgi:hypothetical protein